MYYQPAIKEIDYWIMFSAFHLLIFWLLLTLPAPIPDEEKKITYILFSHFFVHSGHPLPFCRGGRGWASNQIFKKWGRDRTSTFRGGLQGKRGITCFK